MLLLWGGAASGAHTISRYADPMKKLPRQSWIIVLIVGGVIAAGIWAFGVDKPPRTTQVEIALRNIDAQRAELGVRETDHLGNVYFYKADGPDLDYSLVNRPRSIFTDPITLASDTDNAPSKVRITMRGLSDSEVKLGLRSIRPNRNWGSSRFPRSEAITLQELSSQDWYFLSPLSIRVTYHQPLVDAVRILVYIAAAFAFFFGVSWFIWRRWLN